jgi:hypothetical protein
MISTSGGGAGAAVAALRWQAGNTHAPPTSAIETSGFRHRRWETLHRTRFRGERNRGALTNAEVLKAAVCDSRFSTRIT